MSREKKILRLILGDQLNFHHSWYKEKSDNVFYLLMEIRQETDYVKHHIQKIIAFFLAMRSFAEDLREKGHQVIYLKINDKENREDLKENLKYIINKYKIDHFEYQLPDEYRLDDMINKISENLSVSSKSYDTEHFLSKRYDLKDFFRGIKSFLMETFYRSMRKNYNILMEGDVPSGGKWNYDKENREKLPPETKVPTPRIFKRNVKDIKNQIDQAGIDYTGRINTEEFIWPVSRDEVLILFKYFLKEFLPMFGKYQDAMSEKSWSVFHSRISFGLNAKLVSPLEIIQQAEKFWKNNRDSISIAQIEGFIRQILGWREYMRGIYWAFMPEYSGKNYFNHQGKLPAWFWTGDTKMNCLSHAVNQSLDKAYAHHIQRLMITGNFGLLAGIHPDEMDAWYLGVYIDAIEWVEITNTRGMSQFADGGIVGTKPYVSSANYIYKMGDYCASCFYNHTTRIGKKACPYNSLFWHFYERNRIKLENNPRVSMMYRTWDKMDTSKRDSILNQAKIYLNKINEL